MAAKSMRPWRVVMTAADWQKIAAHHFRPDGDEHGSVLACGVVDRGDDRRLIVREVWPAEDGVDYVPGQMAHRLLRPEFIVNAAGRCADERLAYLAVHNHFGDDTVSFSATDLASHERGYPALLDITDGGPLGALVITPNAVAGDIWTAGGRAEVADTIVVGSTRSVLRPRPMSQTVSADPDCDRQIRLFGDRGQEMLGRLRVAVVGLGGAGSMINQMLAHLRVGTIVGVDDDVLDETNLPRVVGSTPKDARKKVPKAEVAHRLAASVNPRGRFVPLRMNITESAAAEAVLACDAIFLAADSMQARHVVNAICHQYLIPGFQVGAKVDVEPDGTVGEVYSVARLLLPEGSCLWCAEAIDRTRLQLEALDPAQRQAARYVPEVPSPSVITLNAMSTAYALNDFLFMFTGLSRAADMDPRWYDPRDRAARAEALAETAGCRECAGRRARGDRRDLPIRMPVPGGSSRIPSGAPSTTSLRAGARPTTPRGRG